MKNYPVFLPLTGQKVVIAGGGDLAARKARLLSAADAELVIIARVIEAAVQAEFVDKATFIMREPVDSDFVGAKLAIVAEEAPELQHQYAAMARTAGALVNVVDAPDLCDFTTPSIINRDDVVIAISTNGKAPVLGRSLREKIEQMLPQRLGALVAFAGAFRGAVKASFGHRSRAFWERFFSGPVAEQVLAGDEVGAREAMVKAINGQADETTDKGVVHIVGAGPGDPELLTIRAHRILQAADVIVYDRLVGDGILNLARRDAGRIYVGKAKSNHSVPQDQINETLVSLAREGKTVVRLKGGDPFVFGRGGEELDALRAANIPAYITPGITAATGCAAAAGMALTHRDFSQSVTFVTGHAKNNGEPDLNWQALADLKNTLVIYMGVGKAANIADQLIRHGRSANTPVAVIENGTRMNQVVARGTLRALPLTLERSGIKGPAILVIGEVASLADEAVIDAATPQQKLRQQDLERLTA